MRKIKLQKLSIIFLMLSLSFSSLAPSLSQAREILTPVEVAPVQLESNINNRLEGDQEFALPIPEEVKPAPIFQDIGEGDDNQADIGDIIDDNFSDVDDFGITDNDSIEDLLNPLKENELITTEDGTVPLDMYDNRDNSGLKPKDQTGQYNVDEFTGVFSYDYAIEVPKGRSGMEPSVSLNYNHRRVNIGSYVGFGWEVNIPSIERENRTGIDNLYNENYFMLSGARLEPISIDGSGYGTYGRLVESSFDKIEFNSSNKWVVIDKLGTVYTYGSSSFARQDNPVDSSQVYKWMLEEVRDTNDNFVRYEYYKDSGQIYPKKIIYTGHGVSDGIFTVNFEPFASGSPTEDNLLNLSYQTGFEVRTKYLLDRIDVKISGDLVTSYDLDLDLNTNENKYLLSSITPRFYQDGQQFIKDKEEFEYSYQATTYVEGEGYELPNNYHLGENMNSLITGKRDMFIDLNSDSFPDYIRFNCSSGNLNTDVYLNNGNGGWTQSGAYSENFGSGFTCAGIGTRYSIPVSFAELNGDHLIDMVTDTSVYYNNGSGWDSPIASTLPVSLFQTSGPNMPPMNVVMFSDMNRDGYDDIVYNHHPNSSTSRVDVYMKDVDTGSWDLDSDYSLNITFDSAECLWGGDPYGFTDINSDGLLDIYYNYYCIYSYDAGVPIMNEDEAVYLNTGESLSNSDIFISPNRPNYYVVLSHSGVSIDYITDIDGDSIYDIGNYSKDYWRSDTDWHSNGGMSLLGQIIFDTGWMIGLDYYNNSLPVAVVDFNGDQVQDVMHSWGSTNDLYYGKGTKLDILKQINYQSGAKIYIHYDYSANEKDVNGNLLNPELPYNLYVVKEVVVDDSLDNWQGIQYQYEDGQAESYPNDKIKDVFGFEQVQKKIGQAMPDVDMGDGSDGVFVSTGDETWTTDKNFTSLNIQSGHTITIEPGAVIKVQGQATINGILTADGQGFAGGIHLNYGGDSGDGPGGGGGGYGGVPNVSSCGGAGAGYSSNGQDGQGCQAGYGLGGSEYGYEDLEIIFKGSGGGGSGDRYEINGSHGGDGGGIIQLFAENLLVNGQISADGNNGGDGYDGTARYTGGGGGGSGGSIYIRVKETADLGSGIIHANGGLGGHGYYSNSGGNGADGRIRIEAKNIIGTTNPTYYSLGHFNYSIDNGLDAGLQKTVNEYHSAKNDNLYLHGRLKSSSSYDKQDNLLSKKSNNWLTYDLPNSRKFAYLDEQVNTQVHLLEEGPLAEYSSDASTIALYHMDGVLSSAEKKDNAQGNVAYDLTEQNIDAIDVGFNNEENGAYRSLGDTRLLNTHIQGLGGGAFTIEIWAKHNGGKIAANRLLGNKNYYDQGFCVEYDWANSRIFFQSTGDRYIWTAYSEPGSIRLGEWQHFAFIMDTNNAYIYVDGELSGQASVTMVENPVISTDLVFFCGRSICNDAGLFSIDEARISSIARSANEVFNYYHNTQEPYYEINQAKKNYYNFTNGNLETEANLGKVVANIDTGQITDILSGDEKDTDYLYAQNTTKHILSAPKNKIISDTNDSKEQELYYDNLPLGEVDKVNLTKEDYIEQDVEVNRNFNAYGLVSEEISPENATTTVAYDSFNLYPSETTNSLNQTTYTEYNLLNGQVATTTSPTGAKTANKYDAFGRLKEVKISSSDNADILLIKQKIIYNDISLPRYKEIKDYFDSGNYVISREYYDGLGRTIQKKSSTASVNQFTTIDIAYDSQGRISQQTLPYITATLEYASSDFSQPSKAYTYDALNRVLSEATPTGVTSYEYNGWTTIITDANGNQKELTKDAHGNLVEVKEYNNNGADIYTTNYDYSLTNKLTKITDSQGNIRNFSYDALDNLQWQDMVHKSSVSNPKKIQYTHDKNGNVLTEASFKGDAISYEYDSLGRVLYEKLSDTNQISYIYDQNDDIGQLSFVDYGNGNSKAYDYDILGRLRTATTTIENEVFVMKYDYNLNGDTKEIQYPNGWKVIYSFNPIGQTSGLSLDKGQGPISVANNIEYNQNGQMTHLERANGVVSDYTYDPDKSFRLTNVLTTKDNDTLQDIIYTYDSVGNITDIIDNSDNDLAKSVQYDYDDLNRLLSAQVSYANHPADDYTQTFQYDPVGNMIYNSDLDTMNYANDNPHQLSGYGSRTFVYDDAGNMTRNGGITKFAWDWRNRLKNTYDIASEKNTYYKYDHNNQRFLKYTEELIFIPPDPEDPPFPGMMGMKTETLEKAGGSYELQRVKEDKYVDKYFEKDIADNEKSHLFLASTRLATLKNNDNPYYILSDHLGSSSILTDSTGQIVELSDYQPYGIINYESTITNLGDDYTFTGHEYDEESSLQYSGARYLDNQVGRFLSVEPVMLVLHDGNQLKKISGQELQKLLSDPQTLNSYAYSKNNPVIFVDPDGNWWKAFFTGQQSWSSFQTELGQAAQQLYNDSSTAKTIMDHPYASGAAIGIGSGLAAWGASAAITTGLTELGILSTQTDKVDDAVDFTQRFGQNLGSRMNDINNVVGNKGYQFYDHALKRMAERNISPNTVINTLNNSKPFEYLHNGVMKYGYYNQDANIFIGQLQSSKEITTVINNVSTNYINNLINTIK